MTTTGLDVLRATRADPSRVTVETPLPPDVQKRFEECLRGAVIDFTYMAFGVASPSRTYVERGHKWGVGFLSGFDEGVARANAIDVTARKV